MQTEIGPQDSVHLSDVVQPAFGLAVQTDVIPPATSCISTLLSRRTVSALRASFLPRFDFMDVPCSFRMAKDFAFSNR